MPGFSGSQAIIGAAQYGLEVAGELVDAPSKPVPGTKIPEIELSFIQRDIIILGSLHNEPDIYVALKKAIENEEAKDKAGDPLAWPKIKSFRNTLSHLKEYEKKFRESASSGTP